jgi:hypothetical protein
MHVPVNPVPRAAARPPFAAAVVAMFASVVGVANAVEFDEKMKAPQAKDAAELRSRAQTFSGRAAQARLAGAAAVIRDRSLSATRFDVVWELQRAIDSRQALGDLSAEGIVDGGDGTYVVDLGANPQWNDPAEQLAGLLPALSQALLDAELSRRGMQPGDLSKLHDYLAAHDVKAATGAAALPIAVGFSRVVRKYDRIKRPVPDSLVLAFLYQRERATTEARRSWAEGLLDSLGPDGARVLGSYFDEMKSTEVWAPSDSRAGIDGLLANLRLPDFEQKAAAEAQGVTP